MAEDTMVGNSIVLQGDVAEKHKLRFTASGTPVLDLSLRIDTRQWVKVVVFGKMAYTVHKHITAGQFVQLIGRMAENGKVVADKIHFKATSNPVLLPSDTKARVYDADACPTCHRQKVPLNTGFSHSDIKYCPNCEK